MNKIKSVIIIILILGLSSCDDDFLDVTPSNSGDASTSIQTLADAKVMLTGIMSRMTSSNYYGRNFILYGDAKGGDLTTFSMGRGLDGLYSFNHSPTSGSYSGFWNSIYNSILQTNNLIVNIEKLQAAGVEANFDDVKGQALTARALMYFDLVRIYGKPYSYDKESYGVPNILEPLDALAQPLRATVADNYNQIITDLKDAQPLLSKSKTNGYLNYYANLAIQARVYLNMGQYPDALTAAEEIIDSGVYTLYSNNGWVDSWTGQFGSESIFELAILPSESDLGNSSLSVYLRRAGHGSASAIGQFIASDYYLNRLGEDPNDVRWGILAHDEVSSTHMGASYKYSGDTALGGDGKSTATAVNIKVIRLSEIYLIAAEAAFHSDKDLAATYLNEIRKRAPDLAPATDATITIDMILDEKSKELFTEGHRYFDMLRLDRPITFNDDLGGVPISTREKTIDRSFYKTILPISQEEINANPDIGNQQNPGY
ncbi:RagB/SusD family nutrient uptake outer membrane protein [Gelidibacter japonicus]|jgi:tetratricopeptide (TPR) repeat protein|uniref:RagB/SusD family nutrient uptake outer membrane protein n=1 Tax=Gelidibacter japonicus TaxID=1962232 RepID=UPI0013CF56BF|nr:RagB/SusD family nutrient uptake outer membrane protein [Gelidibacter japonicus]MCL8006591.1 RagB/SusD family nutrient uptake outer membrane protein [Gelidibacter japonicus]